MTNTKVATVAKEIRKELKEVFPNVKFSVRSSNYSMGSSIYISWTDLPSVEAVEAVTNKYANVRRCEITGEILSGGNMYVSTSQELSKEFRELLESQLEEHEKDGGYYSKRAMSRIMNQMWNEQQGGQQKETNSKTLEVEEDSKDNQATLTINDEKQGIEIKFNSKPSDNIISALKAIGFKYSVKQKLWWAKNTIERFTYATTLVETFNTIIVEGSMEEVEEVETIVPAYESNATVVVNESIETNQKVKVEKIVFEWSESAEIEDGHTVYSFAEANDIIRDAAKKAPSNGAYDKTKFIITFEDGQAYTGRFDIEYKHMFKGSLSEHVMEFVTYQIKHSDNAEMWQEFYDRYELQDPEIAIVEPAKANSNVVSLSSYLKSQEPQMTNEQRLKLHVAYQAMGVEETEKMLKVTTIDKVFEYLSNAFVMQTHVAEDD